MTSGIKDYMTDSQRTHVENVIEWNTNGECYAGDCTVCDFWNRAIGCCTHQLMMNTLRENGVDV